MSYPISDVTRRVVYSGSAGTGPYSFSFEILTNTDIAVYKNTTLLTLTTNYTVTINSNGTGSVTLVSAATGSDQITLVGDRSIERATDFVTGGDLFANSLNDEFDSLVIYSQQIKEEAGRGLKAPITDPTDVNMVLPVKASRKGKVLAFDSTTGDPVAGPALDAVTTVIDQSANINTVATNIASVNTVAGNNTNINTVAGISGNVTTVAGISAAVTTNATNIVAIQNASTNATNAATSASNAATAQTAAEAARDATLAAYDSFDDRYLGAKSSNPSVDNDGNALLAGALYYNTTVPEMRLYTGSAWVAAYVSGASYLLTANNLSELSATASTVRTNLGLVIGTNVQAWDADLDTFAGKTAPTGTIVGTSDSQTLTNKTLTAPTLASANITTALTLTGSAGTAGQALVSGGSGLAPTWSTVSSDTVGFKNRILNGQMVIDQRNAGASVTLDNSGSTYPADRWLGVKNVAGGGTLTGQQVSDAPAGFKSSIKVTATASATIASGDIIRISQRIEGYNVADMGFGAVGASTFTFSFWVKSSLTGTFGGAFANDAWNRSYPFTYTINSANTWEQKTLTVVGDTSGTWQTTNAIGLAVNFGLGVGSTYSGTAGAWAGSTYASATGATSLIGTLNATWQVTGVQLEKGSTATSFDYRPYGTELALCQRYFISYGGDTVYNKGGFGGSAASGTGATNFVCFPVQMRATPSFSYTGSWAVSDGVAGTAVTSLATLSNQSSSLIGLIQITVASGLTTYRPYWLESSNSTASKINWSAEL